VKSPAFEILYIDQDILVINKPAGWLTIQDGYDPNRPYLAKALRYIYGPLWVVHRLDRDTSGVLLFARTQQAHRNLNQQFETRLVKKTYHALTVGVPQWDSIEIDYPLLVNGDRRHRTIVDFEKGRPARTFVRVLCRFQSGFALLEVQPYSGYTHQIRAHISSLGLQILGDTLYRPHLVKSEATMLAVSPPLTPSITPQVERIALHAYALEFDHPTHKQRLSIQAPYPEDFTQIMNILEQQK